MKKALTLVLTLALALSLVSPAIAAGADPIAVDAKTAAELAEKYGLDMPPDMTAIPTGDFGYSVKGANTPPVAGGYDDPSTVLELLDALEGTQTVAQPMAEEDIYAAYEAAHPEELANLDVDALIAGWGYKDSTAEEQFVADYSPWGGEEDAGKLAKKLYIQHRQALEDLVEELPAYQAAYPELWADFDADAYFEAEMKSDWDNVCRDKATFIAQNNIQSEEEFEALVFIINYIPSKEEENDWDYGYDYGYDDDPTLTLYVNGAAGSVEVTAEDGVTYADAVALRGILGTEGVPADAEGPVAIRAAAEAAGWDVGWCYRAWPGVYEIQLWDKATYEAALEEEFAPLNAFLSKVMAQSVELIFSEKATSGHEKLTLDLTRFSTLDGDKKYTLTLEVDYVVQNGVMDVTLTFDVANLLKLFTPEELDMLALNGGGFDLEKLTALLTGGKAEFIIDYNEGEVAWNVPLLALADEDMAGWHSMPVPGLADFEAAVAELEEFSLTSTLYAQMTASAQYRGALSAALSYQTSADMLGLFLGKDRFSTDSRGRTVYSLTTQEMNEALSQRLAETTGSVEGLDYSFCKSFDLRYTMDEQGNVTMEMHIRPDKEGIARALMASSSAQDGAAASLLARMVLSALDVELTATAEGSPSRATEALELHWNNVGKLSLRSTATTKETKDSPRSIYEIVNKD